MKSLNIFLLILSFNVLTISAQNVCSNGRFIDSTFSVQVSSDIVYGSNKNYDGTNRILQLDVYEPLNDNLDKRPVILFAPKGSFLQESKTEHSMVRLCNYFASLGYVAVSLDYRVGVDYFAVMQNPEYEFAKAVLRAAHDYKAAIRFLRKDAYTLNTYRIDTNMIIAGGSSAGAITAIQLAYLNKESEIPVGFDTTGLGGQEGQSGNAGYSSRPHFVVNLCGAISDTAWIEANDIPIISMHGNLDTEVPYGTATISMVIPISEVDGSASIKQRCNNVGTENWFYTFWAKQHIPYDENAGGDYELYMDTVLNYVSTNLYPWVCSQYTGDSKTDFGETPFKFLQIENQLIFTNNQDAITDIKLFNITGNCLRSTTINPKEQMVLNIEEYFNQLLIVSIHNETYTETKKIIFNKF